MYSIFKDKFQNCSRKQYKQIFTQRHKWNWNEYKYVNNDSEKFYYKNIETLRDAIEIYASGFPTNVLYNYISRLVLHVLPISFSIIDSS